MKSTEDTFERHLRLMGRITALFKARGWDLVIVGGSALEFYTEGQYLSGDIDVCRRQGQKPIPPVVEKEVMLAVGAVSTGTRRQWKVGDIFIDLLGEIETSRDPVFRTLETPAGPVQLMPAEDVLVERIFVAHTHTPPEPNALGAAKKMAAAAIAMRTAFDWDKAIALAQSGDYGVEAPLRALVRELTAPPSPSSPAGRDNIE